jgi:hypothetical protein
MDDNIRRRARRHNKAEHPKKHSARMVRHEFRLSDYRRTRL